MKNNKNLIDNNQLEEMVRNYFSGNPVINCVYIHGSYAKNCLRADSDIDIAILPNRGSKISGIELLEMASDLEIALGRKVDLGKLSSENLIYAKEAILNGKCILSSNEFEKNLFIAQILSMYADLQFERKEVIYAYSAR